ncbi:MAG: DegV family protein [Anaerolineae bacterium]|jgi:DegV family protein with EDD domain
MTNKVHDVAIVTDSTSDIPAELVQKHNLTVVPLYVIWGDDQLRDGVDIDQPTFYARLPRDPIHPQTSQPTPADFVQAIERLEAQQVLIVTVSKALSGTYESACQARELLEVPVHVVDSYSLSLGLGWQVVEAARARDEGAGIEEMIATVERVREKMSLLLTVDTLEYLHRGGRIGGAAKLLGSIVQLKPLLCVNHSTGTLEAVEKTRTRKRALRRLVDETLQRVDPRKPLHAAVIHGAAPEDAKVLLNELLNRCDQIEVLQGAITPVLGVHGGPGVVGIAAYNV